MRSLALLLYTAACTGADAVAPGDSADSAEDPDLDETDPPVEKVDTGLALVYVEGEAVFGEETWVGEEHYVATSSDGAVEHCRVTNVAEGVPASDPCPGCAFAFELTLGAGSVAGEACENMHLTADMFDGDSFLYGFAATYTYGGTGYAYADVLLFGERVDGTVTWTPWAFAEVHYGADGQDILFESIFAYTAYYYYL